MIEFTWDARKARRNEREHQVSFAIAQAALESLLGVEIEEQFRGGEWRTIIVAPLRSTLEAKMKTPATTRKYNKNGKGSNASSGSSRPAKPRRTNKPSTSQPVLRPWGEPLTQHDLDLIERLVQMPDGEINVKDIPETKSNTFENKSGIHTSGLFKPCKQQITLRIDSDVLAWAKRGGEGYQTRINAALRSAMLGDAKRNGAKLC